jgi:hypothetical protein
MRNSFPFHRALALRNLKIISMAAALILFAAQPVMVSAQQTVPQNSPQVVPVGSGTSANWAGYVAQGSTYTAVSASWTVPTVSAANVSTAADATWVGIGGVSSQDLIQAGTQAVVQNGNVQYQAWYELLPNYQTQISLAVHAGDVVSVSLAETSENNWSLTFLNNTTGQTYQKNITYASSNTSAEWIEEMPVGGTSRSLNYLPLDNFGAANFTNASVVANGTSENISAAGAQSLTMVSSGQALATPSSITSGTSFSVTRTNTPVVETNQYTQNGGRGFARHGNGIQGFTRGQRSVATSTARGNTEIQQIAIPTSLLRQMGMRSGFRFIFLQY